MMPYYGPPHKGYIILICEFYIIFRNIVLNSLCKKTRKELEAKIKVFANAMHPYAQVIYEYSYNPSLGIVNA